MNDDIVILLIFWPFALLLWRLYTKQRITDGLLTFLAFWPAIIWILHLAAVIALTLGVGCQLSAAGPQPCVILGHDIGTHIYGLWAIPFALPYVMLWALVVLLIRKIVRILRR